MQTLHYCPFQINLQLIFSWYFAYFLSEQDETHPSYLNILDELWDKISYESVHEQKIFLFTSTVKFMSNLPIDPIVKILRIFTMGVYGQIFCLSSDSSKILHQSSSKMLK